MTQHASADVTPDGHWWKNAVVYQLYPRSFADSNGDGIGDLEGIRQHLDHLRGLGVEAIWLTPCFPSPQRDHGYDVADYFDIEPAYGSLDDFDRLMAAATERGIRIMLDVVPNHCSSEHAWFKAAVQAGPGSPERARYWFRDGQGANGDEPPNNWRAIFGGPAWTRVTEADGTPGQWYLHTFSPWQPDFNWYNPEVVDYFDRMLRFWFDRGVDGFRVDAVPVLGKHPELPDIPNLTAGLTGAEAWRLNVYGHFYETGHDVWKHWREVIDEYERSHPGRHLVTISESYGKPASILEYLRGDEFHQTFGFDLMLVTWLPEPMRKSIADSIDMLEDVSGVPAWTLNNHDTQRIVTRLGRLNANDPKAWTGNNLKYIDAPIDLELGRRRARAAVMLTAALPGALYLYQGEELGLEEYLDMPDEARQDPLFIGTNGKELGRDGCRAPLPWTSDASTSFGFSPSAVKPWLPQPADWAPLSVEREEADPNSMLRFYRHLLATRPQLTGDLKWVDSPHPDCLAFERDGTLVVLNTGAAAVDLPDSLVAGRALLLASQPDATARRVPSDTCVWLRAE
ncbi:MAG TPA: glycoside hydrolase family 13 protein [Ilumatobacteraceae bacterium]|jgi:alpha-glucosidase